MFGTRNSNPDSVFKSKKSRVPHEKKMFGSSDLNEDWNPNLNFMWIPSQFWVQPFTCFWIQAGFKSGLNSFVGPSLLPLLGPLFSFPPIFSLSSRLLCFSLSCSRPLQPVHCSLLFSHYRAPLSLHYSRPNPHTGNENSQVSISDCILRPLPKSWLIIDCILNLVYWRWFRTQTIFWFWFFDGGTKVWVKKKKEEKRREMGEKGRRKELV